METGQTHTNSKALKLAKCSICYQIPSVDCNWHQGRCPHREPMISQSVIRNFLKFFKRSK